MRKLGCSGVELVPPELWAGRRRHGPEMPLAHNGARPGLVKGLNNPRFQPEVIARTKATIEQCAEAGVPNVIAFTGYRWVNGGVNGGVDGEGPLAGEIPRLEGSQNTVRGLKELAPYAAAHGVTICLEHLNSRDASDPMKGHPGYQGDDIDYCADIILRVDSPHVKLLFDVYHVAIMNGDVIRRLRQYRDLIGHIHVAGVPGRGNRRAQEIFYPAGCARWWRSV